MKVQFISELLYNHECVIVPGLGGFLTSYLPARIIQGSNRFYPPSCKIAFNASLSANDGILASHISKTTGVSYQEAVESIRKWVDNSYKFMHSGEKLQLEGIGYLRLNSEGNLQFEPELRENFLGNSFGLPSFFAKAVFREEEDSIEKNIPRVKGRPSKMKRLIPETLKWAAVLAPFVAFTLWGSFNSGKIGNYVQSYSGMFSWVRTTPGKTATINANTYVIPGTRNENSKVFSPSAILNQSSISYSPSTISYSAIRSKGLLTAEANPIESEEVYSLSDEYFIIGGAFREHTNALKMIDELTAKGYPAAIIDTTSHGMYVVSIKGFSLRTNAVEELASIKGDGYSGAWIMHKD
jgi:hypothetical protein